MLLLAVLAVLACKPVTPAPQDLDALTHFFFLEFDNPEEDLLVQGVENLEAIERREGLPEGFSGGLTRVGRDHRRAVGMPPSANFEAIHGVFELVERAGCSADDMGNLYRFDDQILLFPNEYEAYDRTYDGNQDCFVDRTCDRMEYSVTIAQKLLGKSLDYTLVVQLRRLRDDADDTAALMVRTFLPDEALVGGSTDGIATWDQSYQVEVVFSSGKRRSVHHYGLWNSGSLPGIAPDADVWGQQYLDGVQDYNDRLDELCVDERSLWD